MFEHILFWLLLAVAGAVVQRASDAAFGQSIERIIYSVVSGRRSAEASLKGSWDSSYEYLSDDDGTTHVDTGTFKVSQRGRRVVMKDPGGSGRSRMVVRGTLRDGGVLSGEWEEHTLAGRHYTGAVQFLLSRTGNQMQGQWVGFTRHDTVQSGPWTLSRIN